MGIHASDVAQASIGDGSGYKNKLQDSDAVPTPQELAENLLVTGLSQDEADPNDLQENQVQLDEMGRPLMEPTPYSSEPLS